jgi:hypothetical protein
MRRKRLNAMSALSKFLLLLAVFQSATNAQLMQMHSQTLALLREILLG